MEESNHKPEFNKLEASQSLLSFYASENYALM